MILFHSRALLHIFHGCVLLEASPPDATETTLGVLTDDAAFPSVPPFPQRM